MQTILVTGGTGFVGQTLVPLIIKKGYKVIILSRSGNKHPGNGRVSYAQWDIEKNYIDPVAISSADAIIHLAGAGVVDKRWSASYKKEILNSRVQSGRLIINSLKNTANTVKTIISSSAIGWYGPDRHDGHSFTEDDPAYDDFLGNTCREWEESMEPAVSMGIRLCKLRTGIVLGKAGGAFKEFCKPLAFGVAGILGNGKQMVSWVHINDLCNMFVHALENSSMHGSYNAVGPVPVSNRELTLTMATIMKGKLFLPVHVPSFILKIMMGESSIEVLKSTTVSADKILRSGFVFQYPDITSAIKDLVKK